MDPVFVLGPLHGERLAPHLCELMPEAIGLPDYPVVYMKTWWWQRPGQGFWYYAAANERIEEIIAAVQRLMRDHDHQS